jgi:hypothetical protein
MFQCFYGSIRIVMAHKFESHFLGRGEEIVQTTNATHYSIVAAAKTVAGTKIRWGLPRVGSSPGRPHQLFQL